MKQQEKNLSDPCKVIAFKLNRVIHFRKWKISLKTFDKTNSGFYILVEKDNFKDVGVLNGNKGPIIWENPDEIPSRVSFLALNILKNAREIMKESNQKSKQVKQNVIQKTIQNTVQNTVQKQNQQKSAQVQKQKPNQFQTQQKSFIKIKPNPVIYNKKSRD